MASTPHSASPYSTEFMIDLHSNGLQYTTPPRIPSLCGCLYIDGWLGHLNCLGQWGARKYNSNRGLLLETACYVPGREGAQHPH